MKRLSDTFTKEYMARLETLSLPMQARLSASGYGGQRKSTVKGSSLEFSDYREYSHGDDLRRVDWNSFARFGRLYLKLFMEEKQASVNLFLDRSLSMAEGEKLHYAKVLLASLSYIALKHMDQVQIYTWDAGLGEKKTNVTSPQRFLEIVHFLDKQEPSGETKLADMLRSVGGLPLGRGLSVVFSDFLTAENWLSLLPLFQQKKQEVLLIWIRTQEEENPTLHGSHRLVDVETGEVRDIEITHEVREAYLKAQKDYTHSVHDFCKKRGIGLVMLSDTTSPLLALQKLL